VALTSRTVHSENIQDLAGVCLAFGLGALHVLELDENCVDLAHNVLNDPLHALDSRRKPVKIWSSSLLSRSRVTPSMLRIRVASL
jgi:hypothetical protein